MALGLDGISNLFINKSGRALQNFLRKLYNMSLGLGYVPSRWKVAMVVPLPRQGKYLSSPGGYRPVSLLSVIGKLLETMLATRLASSLQKNGAIPSCQSAFRAGHSTSDQTFKLSQLAHVARARKEIFIAAFIDFEGAFNAVWYKGLQYKISKCKAIANPLKR